MSDEFFDEFLQGEGFAPAIDCRTVDEFTLLRYQNTGKLPDRLIKYWKEYGFCGYGEGLFWTVNPDDYKDLLEIWLGDTSLWERENFYVIARSAFGELYAIGADCVDDTIIDPHLCNILPADPAEKELSQEEKDRYIGIFFEMKNKKSVDYNDQNDKPLFQRALKKLGPLKYDEMYSFVPALAAGGAARIENLQIVKIQEQLALLAELDSPVILTSVGELFGS